MHNAIPLILAALLAVGIIVIGCFYLVSPERISGTFGLKPPASDADTRAWLRPKSSLLATCQSFWGRAGRSRERSQFMA